MMQHLLRHNATQTLCMCYNLSHARTHTYACVCVSNFSLITLLFLDGISFYYCCHTTRIYMYVSIIFATPFEKRRRLLKETYCYDYSKHNWTFLFKICIRWITFADVVLGKRRLYTVLH